MFILGVTGPSGSGKSTVLSATGLHTFIINADSVYHGLLDRDEEFRKEIEDRFGALRNEDGTFSRKKLADIVFHDSKALEDLNKIVQIPVYWSIRQQLAEAQSKFDMGWTAFYQVAIIEAINLFDSDLYKMCNATLAVIAPPETRMKRIMERDSITEEQAAARISAQKPDEYFESRCTYTLHNNFSSIEEFKVAANTMIKEILK